LMHLDTVRANAMKFCREYPFVQGKVMAGSPPPVGGWVKFHPGYDTLQFLPIVEKCWRVFFLRLLEKPHPTITIPCSHAGCESIYI